MPDELAASAADSAVGAVASSRRHGIDRLIGILAALRAPETGCPWDLRQTHASLAPYAIEEAYELADAIDRGDFEDIRDELGDCLLQVVFHARVAEEAGTFDFGDVADAIAAKMERRHPHVFGDAATRLDPTGAHDTAAPPGWERIKEAERALRAARLSYPVAVPGLLADVPVALPGLTRAVKLQQRAATVGFDWHDMGPVLAKVREEIDEVEAEIAAGDATALADEIGDLLFAIGNLARHAAVDPEAALRSANSKFARRFAHIERRLAEGGSTPHAATLTEMEALWEEAKRLERANRVDPVG